MAYIPWAQIGFKIVIFTFTLQKSCSFEFSVKNADSWTIPFRYKLQTVGDYLVIIYKCFFYFPESDSNSESDTEGSEEDDDDDKDQDESDSDTEGEKTSMKLNKTASSVKSPSISLTAHSTPRNLHIAKAPGSAPAALCSESQSPAFLGTPSFTLTSSPHSGTYTLFLLLWSRNQTITRILIYTVFWGWSHWNQGREFRLRKVSVYFQRIWLTTIFSSVLPI